MAVVQDPDGNKIIIHKLKPENEKEPLMIKEVAFVAIAVSDEERAREILSGNSRAEADHDRNGRRVGRIRSWADDNRCWLSSGLETVTRWDHGRF